jgi:hypothetical protein
VCPDTAAVDVVGFCAGPSPVMYAGGVVGVGNDVGIKANPAGPIDCELVVTGMVGENVYVDGPGCTAAVVGGTSNTVGAGSGACGGDGLEIDNEGGVIGVDDIPFQKRVSVAGMRWVVSEMGPEIVAVEVVGIFIVGGTIPNRILLSASDRAISWTRRASTVAFGDEVGVGVGADGEGGCD